MCLRVFQNFATISTASFSICLRCSSPRKLSSRSYMRLPCLTDARRTSRCRHHFQTADRSTIARCRRQARVIGSPARVLALTISGDSLDSPLFVRKSRLPANGCSSAHQRFCQFVVVFLRVLTGDSGDFPASRHIMMPSLSVDHGVPSKAGRKPLRSLRRQSRSCRRTDINKPFETYRDFYQLTAQVIATRSIIAEETSVLPTATSLPTADDAGTGS